MTPVSPPRPAVLVVDDEPDILIAIEDQLDADYRVLAATGGAEGLDLLARHPDIVAVVSDQRMPRMTGDQFLAEVRASSDAGTILLTGYADLPAVVSAVNRGGISGYLTKPWDAAALKSLVATVAERCLLARELALERALLNGLLDDAGDQISFKDRAGRFLRVNRAKAEALGLTPEACLGATEAELDPDNGPAVEAADREAFDGGAETETVAETVDPEHGRTWARTVRKPLGAPGAPQFLMTTTRDVTQARMAELRLRQAEKMQALGTLAGGIAHDFNNLLTAIIGSLELAERRLPAEAERVQRYLRGAREAAERGATLTGRLLGFCRRAELKRDLVDVNDLVRGMTDLLRQALGPKVQLALKLAPPPLTVTIDAAQLELAVLNLCVNARDAMPEGGTVTVSTGRFRVEPGSEGLAPGDYVTLRVVDTGVGIAPDVLARVFEPFFTTKEPGKGTGLGLSMAYSLATAAGGDVQIDTGLGRGTTIELLLPSDEAAAAREAAAAAAERPPMRPARLLVVDDDAAVRAVTASHLRAVGHEVSEADGGAAALALIDAGQAFDLVLVDYAMPAMNGLDLAGAIRARRPDQPILFLTGYADEPINASLYDIIEKPFRADELYRAVARMLGEDATAEPAR